MSFLHMSLPLRHTEMSTQQRWQYLLTGYPSHQGRMPVRAIGSMGVQQRLLTQFRPLLLFFGFLAGSISNLSLCFQLPISKRANSLSLKTRTFPAHLWSRRLRAPLSNILLIIHEACQLRFLPGCRQETVSKRHPLKIKQAPYFPSPRHPLRLCLDPHRGILAIPRQAGLNRIGGVGPRLWVRWEGIRQGNLWMIIWPRQLPERPCPRAARVLATS